MILYYRWREFGHFVAGVFGVVGYDPLGCQQVKFWGMYSPVLVVEGGREGEGLLGEPVIRSGRSNRDPGDL